MKIFRYHIHRARSIRKVLVKLYLHHNNPEWQRGVQLYNSRIGGICFTRSEDMLEKLMQKLKKDYIKLHKVPPPTGHTKVHIPLKKPKEHD